MQDLAGDRARTPDAGTAVLIDQRIKEVQTLQAKSDAELEDYLWVQEAQVNQPLLAYAKLRVMRGPAVRFGPENDPVEIPEPGTAVIMLVELLAAVFLGVRAVLAK